MRAVALLYVLCTAAACGSPHAGSPPDAPGSGTGTGTGTDMPGPDGNPASAQPITPNPIVSRGRPITSSEGDHTAAGALSSLNDGVYQIDGFQAAVTADHQPWFAIDVGAGPTRLLFTFLSEGSVDAPTSTPVAYHLDVSPDGQTWTTAVTVTDNDTSTREHAFDFTGQAWVRMTFDQADASGSVHVYEVEAYDVSHGSDDTWLFLGDSITAIGMNHYVVPDLATRIHGAKPAYTPMVIDEGIGGTQTTFATTPDADGVTPIATWIARFPDMHNVGVDYGTNDAGCDQNGEHVAQFSANLTSIVDALHAAGKRVVIPHIPWGQWTNCQPTNLAPYNAAIDALRASDDVLAGPDLYTYFAAHPDQLSDGVHPDADGQAAMNQMWTTAVLGLYP